MQNAAAQQFFRDEPFAARETTLLDADRAADPEILAKVFEEQAKGRKESGRFYTPPAIVSYMCREGLKGYLAEATKIDRERVAAFVDRRETAFAIEDAGKFALALDELKVVDPACGAGAFLIGMLHEMTDLYQALYRDTLRGQSRECRDIQRRIVAKNLHGVDQDARAVRIARQRISFSIAAESSNPQSVPDLEFRIETGDSLAGPVARQRGAADSRAGGAGVRESAGSTGVIDWGVEFRDVFCSARGGFDIVLANPPYIDSEAMARHHAQLRETIRATYSLTRGNWDLYIAFFERGLQLLGTRGVMCFITPDKWLSKPFGEELRRRTVGNLASLLHVGRSVFESAKVDAVVSVFCGRPVSALRILEAGRAGVELRRTIEKKTLKPPFAYDWLFSEHVDFLLQMEACGGALSDFGLCENACATSDAYKLQELIEEEPAGAPPGEFLRIINTGTIGKYVSKWGEDAMVYLGGRYSRPVVNRAAFLRKFRNSYGCKATRPKLILKGLNLLDACFDAEGSFIPGKTTLMITADDPQSLRLLLAIVNSDVAHFYLKQKYPGSSYNQGTTFTKAMINRLPVPLMSPATRAAMVEKVDRIIAAREATGMAGQTSGLERQLNAIVNAAYGVDPHGIRARSFRLTPKGSKPLAGG